MLHAKVMRVRKSGTDKQRLSEFRNYNSTGADNKSSVRLKRRVGAAMPRKLQPETFLRVAHVLKIAERNFELPVATRAYGNGRHCSEPLHHSKIALHFKLPFGECCAELYQPYRIVCSISEIQSGRFKTSRGFGPSAAPTIPSCSIRSIKCAARP